MPFFVLRSVENTANVYVARSLPFDELHIHVTSNERSNFIT
jgi:hypothetical protein